MINGLKIHRTMQRASKVPKRLELNKKCLLTCQQMVHSFSDTIITSPLTIGKALRSSIVVKVYMMAPFKGSQILLFHQD